VEAASLQSNADRAAATYHAMQRYLYVSDGASLYREEYPWQGGNPYAYLWPFARALIATLSLAGVSRRLLADVDVESAVKDRLSGLTKYWDARANPPAYDSYVRPPLGNGGDKYYDDNAWVALALVEAHRLGFSRSLEQAERLFDFGKSGWDRRPADPYPGGVFWVQQGLSLGRTNHDRGAGLNAGYARLGFLLHELSGSSAPDRDAVKMVNWVNAHLESNGLYSNAIRRDGSIDTNLWTYVQGEMIGARALQYRLTHENRYLDQAEHIARETLSRFGTFSGQPPSFNAMCFQALLLLSTLTRDAVLQASMLQTIQAYADWAWSLDNRARDATTNLFHFTSAGSPARAGGQPAQLQDQAALVQVYSLLAWNTEDYSRLT
jgi:Glycosyl hydrolase family 76